MVCDIFVSHFPGSHVLRGHRFPTSVCRFPWRNWLGSAGRAWDASAVQHGFAVGPWLLSEEKLSKSKAASPATKGRYSGKGGLLTWKWKHVGQLNWRMFGECVLYSHHPIKRIAGTAQVLWPSRQLAATSTCVVRESVSSRRCLMCKTDRVLIDSSACLWMHVFDICKGASTSVWTT